MPAHRKPSAESKTLPNGYVPLTISVPPIVKDVLLKKAEREGKTLAHVHRRALLQEAYRK